MKTIGNNGNQLIDHLHNLNLLKDGMSAEDISAISKPYMINEKHLERDSFWEDVFYRAEELGYKLLY
jgi:hypothetical protein